MQSWKKRIFIGLFSSLLWEQHAVEASIGIKGMDDRAYTSFTTQLATPAEAVTVNYGGASVSVATKPVQPVQWEKYLPKKDVESTTEVGSKHQLLAERKQLVEAGQQKSAEQANAREQPARTTLASRGGITSAYVPKGQEEPQRGVSTDINSGAVSNSAPTLINSSGASATRGNQAVTMALQFQGVPYRYGGTTPNGFDCSGFLQYVMKQVGIDLPRTTYQQIAAGTPVSQANLRPGDLIFFSCGGQATSHSGMYVGNGKFIHADQQRGITIVDLNSSYWSGVYQAAVRVN